MNKEIPSGVYVDGKIEIRIEDDVFLSESGYEFFPYIRGSHKFKFGEFIAPYAGR